MVADRILRQLARCDQPIHSLLQCDERTGDGRVRVPPSLDDIAVDPVVSFTDAA